MQTRLVRTTARPTSGNTLAARTCLALAAAALLTACGSSAGDPGDSGDAGSEAGSGTTTSSSGPATPTVTVTVTSSLPAPTLSRPGKPNPSVSIPPPAKDPLVIPDNPKAYSQAFVTAWLDRDRARAARLGTATAVSTAFASTATMAPVFTTCEGAAGSSYCTWRADELTMTMRVLNEKSSQRLDQAVVEVKFTH